MSWVTKPNASSFSPSCCCFLNYNNRNKLKLMDVVVINFYVFRCCSCCCCCRHSRWRFSKKFDFLYYYFLLILYAGIFVFDFVLHSFMERRTLSICTLFRIALHASFGMLTFGQPNKALFFFYFVWRSIVLKQRWVDFCCVNRGSQFYFTVLWSVKLKFTFFVLIFANAIFTITWLPVEVFYFYLRKQIFSSASNQQMKLLSMFAIKYLII